MGGKVWLGLTPDTCSLRDYESFGAIERMIARTAFNQLRHSVWLLLGATGGLLLIYLLPVVLVLSASPTLTLIGAVAYLLMWVTYLPMVRFYGLNGAWALTLPLSAVFYLAATIHSALDYWSGRGGDWRVGRKTHCTGPGLKGNLLRLGLGQAIGDDAVSRLS